MAGHDRTVAQESGADAPATDVDVTGSNPSPSPTAVIPVSEEEAVTRSAKEAFQGPSIGPRSTLLPRDADAMWEILHRTASPFTASYYYDMYRPTKEWWQDAPQVYVDADHNLQVSVVHRDHSESMAPVLGQIVLSIAPMLEPGVELAQGRSREGPTRRSAQRTKVARSTISPQRAKTDSRPGRGRQFAWIRWITRATSTWGRSARAQARAQERAWIEQGLYKEAQQHGVDDVRKLFGPKYDDHLKQLPPYTGPQREIESWNSPY